MLTAYTPPTSGPPTITARPSAARTGGVQSVGGGQVAGVKTTMHRRCILAHRTDIAVLNPDTGRRRRLRRPRAGPFCVRHLAPPRKRPRRGTVINVGDAVKRLARRLPPRDCPVTQRRSGISPLAARLADETAATYNHDNLQKTRLARLGSPRSPRPVHRQAASESMVGARPVRRSRRRSAPAARRH